MVMTLEELNDAIIAWADANGILEKATPLTQAEKTAEEVEELIRATESRKWAPIDSLKDIDIEIRDAIGDIYVTLVIGLKMRYMQPHVPTDTDDDISPNVDQWCTRLMKHLVWLCTGSASLEKSTIHCMMFVLTRIARWHDTTLRDCAQQAYDVIAKRTGKMVDGVFVKDQP